VATKAGPGGLWIDGNIFLTATAERLIQKVSPNKKLTMTARSIKKHTNITVL
jgi:hypothetical protein